MPVSSCSFDVIKFNACGASPKISKLDFMPTEFLVWSKNIILLDAKVSKGLASCIPLALPE
jgi:hypothetical protein